jgi:hypothetical protein
LLKDAFKLHPLVRLSHQTANRLQRQFKLFLILAVNGLPICVSQVAMNHPKIVSYGSRIGFFPGSRNVVFVEVAGKIEGRFT